MPEQYEEAIALYYKLLEEGQHDSLATVEPFQRHVWDDNGPVNYKRGRDHALSQDLPRWYFVTGVFIAPRPKMVEWYHNMGPRPYMHPLPRINLIDIDDELDLATARLWWDVIVKERQHTVTPA
jgi:CMP-N-acetylneuraminic acid synthetase